MAQAIIILDDQELIEILQAVLVRRYGIDVITMPSAQDAISMMEIVPVDLVVCKEKIGKSSVAFNICNFFQANLLNTHVLTLGKKTSALKNEQALEIPVNHQKLISKIAFILGKEPNDFVEPKEEPVAKDSDTQEDHSEKTTVFQLPKLDKKIVAPEIQKQIYHSFHLKYFLHLPANIIISFSVFTRIKKKDDYDYTLKVPANSNLTKELLHTLSLRAGKELFVKEEDFQQANEFLSKSILGKFNLPLTVHERMQLNSDGYEILMEVFKNSTFNKYSVEIIKEMVKSIDLLMKSPDPLPALMKAIELKKLSYVSAHIHFTCLLIFLMVDRFTWSKEQSKNKIVYLSLFHDLCLNNERVIKLHHRYFEQKNITDEDRALMLNHADSSASILEAIVKAPKELTSLIREHHGIKNGKGFIETMSISISPLSMAFIVCEDFVTRYLDVSEKQDKVLTQPQLDKIFQELKEKYNQMTYMDIALEIPKLFKS